MSKNYLCDTKILTFDIFRWAGVISIIFEIILTKGYANALCVIVHVRVYFILIKKEHSLIY